MQSDSQRRDRRSASMFDPVAGMRVMADIQAEGLRAAGELLERVLQSEPKGNGRPAAVGDYTTLLDAWADVLRAMFGLPEPGRPGVVAVPVEGNGLRPPLRLALDESEPERGTTAEVWLHNGTAAAVGPLVMRCGALRNSQGKKLKGAKVRFGPRKVEPLPPRSSRAVTVSLVPKDAMRPGIYRGTIQADGAPQLWLPVEVVIGPC